LRARPEANPTTPRNPAAHRGKPPQHGLSHEDTSPDGPGRRPRLAQALVLRISRNLRPAARPPRSHSQIRFTRSINTAPESRRRPARNRFRPAAPDPRNQLLPQMPQFGRQKHRPPKDGSNPARAFPSRVCPVIRIKWR